MGQGHELLLGVEDGLSGGFESALGLLIRLCTLASSHLAHSLLDEVLLLLFCLLFLVSLLIPLLDNFLFLEDFLI
jgi:hypothetical protein